MRARSALTGVMLVASLAIAGGEARADDGRPAAQPGDREDSRAAFLRGVAEVHQGNYKAARDDFIQAYKLFAHPSILLNLGIARWHTGEYVAAEQDLARFLSDDGGASQDEIASARAALSAARTHLGTLRVKVAPEGAHASLDGQLVALTPGAATELRATLGNHPLHVEAEGFDPADIDVVVTKDRPAIVEVSLASSATAAPRDDHPVVAPHRSKQRVTAGWVLAGVSVASAGVGAFAGVRAIVLAHDYNRAPPGQQDASTRRTGTAFRTASDLLFITAIGTGAAAAYLLVWPIGKSGAQTTVFVAPSFAGFAGAF